MGMSGFSYFTWTQIYLLQLIRSKQQFKGALYNSPSEKNSQNPQENSCDGVLFKTFAGLGCLGVSYYWKIIFSKIMWNIIQRNISVFIKNLF